MSKSRKPDAMLTDQYQLTTAYANFLQGLHEKDAMYNIFFRRCPFGGGFAVSAGLPDVLEYLDGFRFTGEDISFLRKEVMPNCRADFWEWLESIDCSSVEISAVPEGTIVFPQEPLFTFQAPQALGRMIESACLNLTGFASLVATKAARMRLLAGKDAFLVEFGLRRAQGPDGALTASRSAYLGGFDATSNIKAGQLFGIPTRGSMSHAYIQGHVGMSLNDLSGCWLENTCGNDVSFAGMVYQVWKAMGSPKTNRSELTAFTAFAIAFPNDFLALVDTYNTIESGVLNYIAVAVALRRCGYSVGGIRLDSGNLARLSLQTRELFCHYAKELSCFDLVRGNIFVSNDIDEKALLELQETPHEITGFGIGTRVVTCFDEPALGLVHKLVEIEETPVRKSSEEPGKGTIPCAKALWRIGETSWEYDILTLHRERLPARGEEITVCTPQGEFRRVTLGVARRLNENLMPWLDGNSFGISLEDARARLKHNLLNFYKVIPYLDNRDPYPVYFSVGLWQALIKAQELAQN